MNITKIEEDIQVLYVTADSFPAGIKAAHERLHSIVPFSTERNYYGISRPEGGPIVYKAATSQQNEKEPATYGLEVMTLKKGNYIYTDLHNYMQDLDGIGRAFYELLKDERIDPEGYCIEWYKSDKDVRCMVRVIE